MSKGVRIPTFFNQVSKLSKLWESNDTSRNERNRDGLAQELQELAESLLRIQATSLGPKNELCDIHPAIRCFTVVNIGLGLLEFFANVPLG